jgi:phosphomethylpyrimidine synthase
VQGELFPDVRVPMREIAWRQQSRSTEKIEVNEPVRVYDCSGPWGDPDFTARSRKACPLCAPGGFKHAVTWPNTTAAR